MTIKSPMGLVLSTKTGDPLLGVRRLQQNLKREAALEETLAILGPLPKDLEQRREAALRILLCDIYPEV